MPDDDFWDGWFGIGGSEDSSTVVAPVEDPPGGVGLDLITDPGFGREMGFNFNDPGSLSTVDQLTQEFPPGKELFYDPGTGYIVDAKGTLVFRGDELRDAATRLAEAARIDAKIEPQRWQEAWKGVEEAFAPVNKFLGTSLGGTLGALGLGALGIGAANLFAGDQKPFVPPGRVSVLTNPAATALERRVRMNNLALLDRTPVGGTNDPVTGALTDRLNKALRGEVSNPVLERANRTEDEELRNTFLRKGFTGAGIDTSSAGIEKTGRLKESQAIRAYLDNLETIGRLEPRQAARLAAEQGNALHLSGLDEIGGQRRFDDDLAFRLAYNQYLGDREGRRSLATQLGNLFGGAGGLLAGRRPITLSQNANGLQIG